MGDTSTMVVLILTVVFALVFIVDMVRDHLGY